MVLINNGFSVRTSDFYVKPTKPVLTWVAAKLLPCFTMRPQAIAADLQRQYQLKRLIFLASL